MKKILLAPVLFAAGMSQAQAAANTYNVPFYVSPPVESAVTITFSGFCSGKITDTIGSLAVNVSNDPPNAYSDVTATTTGLNMQLKNVFYAESVGSTTSISNKKGVLSIALKDSSTYGTYPEFDKVHSTGADSAVTCKNGLTLETMLNAVTWSTNFVNDKTQTNKASFTLKGSAAPFDFKYSHTISGYVDLPAVCNNEGTFTGTGNIATDTFTSSCKMVNKVKVKISATASGQIDYD